MNKNLNRSKVQELKSCVDICMYSYEQGIAGSKTSLAENAASDAIVYFI